MPECLACQVNSGFQSPPGGVIFNDGLWQIDHRVHPSPVVGWLIMKPLRHVEYFDELNDRETSVFGPLLKRVNAALRKTLPEPPEKIYTVLLAESAESPHIHFHVIPRLKSDPAEFRGPGIFQRKGIVDGFEIERLVERLRTEIGSGD